MRVVTGRGGGQRVDLGGRRIIKRKIKGVAVGMRREKEEEKERYESTDGR